MMNRNIFLTQSDQALAKDCDFDFFKASGRGGQKRNKSSSAVRITHRPSQITVSDCSSRQQQHNRHEAFKKLRYAIALNLRCKELQIPENLEISVENYRLYPLFVAQLLDILNTNNYSISDSAKILNCSSARLVKILGRDKILWQQINREREKLNLKPLKL